MIDLCRDCPNLKCTKPCQEAYRYMAQDTREDRRGKSRKLIYGFDMNRFQDEGWWEGFNFADGAYDLPQFVKKLTKRQLQIWQKIEEWMEAPTNDVRETIAQALGISRWTLNWELRLMREKAKTCVSEGI